MWLLNCRSRKLEHYNNELEVPGGYAILSHRWRREEVNFSEIESKGGKRKLGYYKIERACAQAMKDGLDFIWVDTCKFRLKPLKGMIEAERVAMNTSF